MNKSADLYHHIFKISPKYACSYYKAKFPPERQRPVIGVRVKNDRFTLSKQAKKTMNNCFAWLRIISNKKIIYSQKEKKKFTFELAFITVTLPSMQKHSDKFIKAHMLAPLLKWMQRSWDCNSYIWKAEVQNNGNIHFHITINKFIHWKSLRTKWNRLCAKHGYCKVFQNGSNDKGDAATNIKAVINTKMIESYVANYCTKKDTFKTIYNEKTKKKEFYYSEHTSQKGHYYDTQNFRIVHCEDGTKREYKRTIQGRLWNASYNLNVPPAWFSNVHEPYKAFSELVNDSSICDKLDKDFATIYVYKKNMFSRFPPDLKRVFQDAREQLRAEDGIQTKLTIPSIY